MGYVAVSSRVIARDDFGRFIAACQEAATQTVQEAIEEGAQLSREMAPVGTEPDPRTIPLKASISSEMLSATSGQWKAEARHAMAQEFGAGPHVITGSPYLSFHWEAEGRRWIPASVFYNQPGLIDVVNHPGNPAQPYLRPAYKIIAAKLAQIAAAKYPG